MQGGGEEAWEVFPGPRWSCLSKGGEGTTEGWPGIEPKGQGFSPLVQEGVEECEEQQRQLGQQCHPVVEVEGICRARVVGAQGLSGAVGPCQTPLEVLPGCQGSGVQGHPTTYPQEPPSLLPLPPPMLGIAPLTSAGLTLSLHRPQHLAHSWSSMNVH